MGADLTDEEIDSICDKYRQNAARVRYLRSLGLTVRQKPSGRPLVNRKHYDLMMAGSQTTGYAAATGPNWRVH